MDAEQEAEHHAVRRASLDAARAALADDEGERA
jgi:hypothetical protein